MLLEVTSLGSALSTCSPYSCSTPSSREKAILNSLYYKQGKNVHKLQIATFWDIYNTYIHDKFGRSHKKSALTLTKIRKTQKMNFIFSVV